MIPRDTALVSLLMRRLSSDSSQISCRRFVSVGANAIKSRHSYNNFLTSQNVRQPLFFVGFTRTNSLLYTNSHRQCLVQQHLIKRDQASSSGNNNYGKTGIDTNTLEVKIKTLRELYSHVKSQISLDIWTLNVALVTFIVGPYVWNSMRTSRHNEDFYMIPVDDPVEHSVRILLDCIGNDSDQTLQDIANNSPEEDAKRILNQFLASESIRTTASRIASEVIQMEPFQNACKKLVKNIWNDLINDEETYSQLTTLLYTVLQNEKMYSAIKDLLLQLVNDDEINRELTKLVVKLGEEPDVLKATQQVLTESAHRTMNDPNVLDHSMEFATEVMGDDVVQRTGGDALWNTVGYAIQPSGNAILAGIGTLIVACVLHFYMSRRGCEGSSRPKMNSSVNRGAQDKAQSQLPTQSEYSPTDNIHVDRKNNVPPVSFHVIHSTMSSITNIPSFLFGSIVQIYNKLKHGVVLIIKTPSWLGSSMKSLSSSVSARISNILNFFFLSCRTGISRTFQMIIAYARNTSNFITDYWCHLLNIGSGGVSDVF